MTRAFMAGLVIAAGLIVSPALAQERGAVPGRDGTEIYPVGTKIYKVSKLVGKDILIAGKDVGEIEDFILSTDRGQILFGVLKIEEIEGVKEDQMFPVPFEMLRFTDGDITVNVDEQKLKAAPNWPENQWPARFTDGMVRSYCQHYGCTLVGGTTGVRSEVVKGGDVQVTGGPVINTIRASQLLKFKVKNDQGQDLGKIEDLVVDIRTGEVAYAALSFGGFLGVGDKLFAIPFELLKPRETDKIVVVNIKKEQLEKSPGFNEVWPAPEVASIYAETNRGALRNIHTYYGTQPYWNRDVEDRKTVRLPFQLEQGKTLTFNVVHVKDSIGTRGEVGLGNDKTIVNPTGEVGQGERRPANVGGGNVGVTASNQHGLVFKFDVTENRGQDIVCQLTVNELKGSLMSDLPTTDTASTKRFTVTLDLNGVIKEVKAAEGLGVTGGTTSTTGTTSTHELTLQNLNADNIRCNLDAIFAAGLHNRELTTGQLYDVATTSGVSTDRKVGATEPKGQDPMKANEKEDAFRKGTNVGTTAKPDLKLRLTGVRRVGELELAVFDVIDMKAGSDARIGSIDKNNVGNEHVGLGKDETKGDVTFEGDLQDDGLVSDRPTGAAAGGRVIGEVSFNLKDGLLVELFVEPSKVKTEGLTSTDPMAQIKAFMIRRVERTATGVEQPKLQREKSR